MATGGWKPKSNIELIKNVRKWVRRLQASHSGAIGNEQADGNADVGREGKIAFLLESCANAESTGLRAAERPRARTAMIDSREMDFEEMPMMGEEQEAAWAQYLDEPAEDINIPMNREEEVGDKLDRGRETAFWDTDQWLSRDQ
eukprot:7023710-Pyramimonas_sp.AAC.1